MSQPTRTPQDEHFVQAATTNLDEKKKSPHSRTPTRHPAPRIEYSTTEYDVYQNIISQNSPKVRSSSEDKKDADAAAAEGGKMTRGRFEREQRQRETLREEEEEEEEEDEGEEVVQTEGGGGGYCKPPLPRKQRAPVKAKKSAVAAMAETERSLQGGETMRGNTDDNRTDDKDEGRQVAAEMNEDLAAIVQRDIEEQESRKRKHGERLWAQGVRF